MLLPAAGPDVLFGRERRSCSNERNHGLELRTEIAHTELDNRLWLMLRCVDSDQEKVLTVRADPEVWRVGTAMLARRLAHLW